ncbi:hypothetical protein AB4Z22_34905 [Paenibacillus sp. TAF58]
MKWRHEHHAVDIIIVGAGAAGSEVAYVVSYIQHLMEGYRMMI